MHCLSHTHKEHVNFVGAAVFYTWSWQCGPGQITWHVASCSGRILLLVRGYFVASSPGFPAFLAATGSLGTRLAILRVDLELWSEGIERSLGHTHKGAHEVRGRCLHVTLLHVNFVPFIYCTSAPLCVHRCNHRQYSTIYGAVTDEVCTSVLFIVIVATSTFRNST